MYPEDISKAYQTAPAPQGFQQPNPYNSASYGGQQGGQGQVQSQPQGSQMQVGYSGQNVTNQMGNMSLNQVFAFLLLDDALTLPHAVSDLSY